MKTIDNSGDTNKVVLKVSWYSDCKSGDSAKKVVFVCVKRSLIVLLKRDSFNDLDELEFNKITSSYEVLEIESISICWLIKEDWKIKEKSDHSDATNEDVFSQLSESDNQAWSVDL